MQEKEDMYRSLNKSYFGPDMHERESVNNLGELLFDGAFFVDVGASLGQYTKAASEAMSGGRIISIEPEPRRFEELERNCHKWSANCTNTIQALCNAVGDKVGPQTFYTTYSAISGGLFPRNNPNTNWEKIEVDEITLDQLFADDSPDLIKIDVEGAELRLLRGATRLLGEGKTKILIEIHDSSIVDPLGQKGPQDVVDFLVKQGYTKSNFHGRSLYAKK